MLTIASRDGRRQAEVRAVADGVEVRFARASGWRDGRDGTKAAVWAWEPAAVIPDAPLARIAEHVQRVLNEA